MCIRDRLRNQNFLKNYYNSILIKGDVIIAISKHIKDNIVNVFPNVKDKVSIVYRGVDLENFNLNNISNTRVVNQAKLLGVRDGSPVILMASRPKAWKGHLIFIKALSKVKIDYQCFLIGALDGDEKFKSNIDWKEVFDIRNELNDMHFNKDNPKFIDWNQDIPNIENELIITP